MFCFRSISRSIRNFSSHNQFSTVNDAVITTKSLCLPDLINLFNGISLAIVVKDFYPKSTAEWASNVILNSDKIQNWNISTPNGLKPTQVHTIGTPFNVVASAGNSAAMDRYFDESLAITRMFRSSSICTSVSAQVSQLFEPKSNLSLSERHFLSPIDQLRLELDEVWPDGANIGKHNGKPLIAGAVRIMFPPFSPNSTKKHIHIDSITPNLFSANVYLKLPSDASGGFEMYHNQQDLDPDLIQALTSEGINRNEDLIDKMVKSSHVIKISPSVGDLLLFSSSIPHAVGNIHTGTRVSIQSFIQFNKGNSLVIDA